jgi:hypothetical protein
LITLECPAYIPQAFVNHVHELATHPYGCRVLQKAFENLDEDLKRPLLDEMHDSSYALMEDQFGSEWARGVAHLVDYVIQSVLVMGPSTDRNKVIAKIKGTVLHRRLSIGQADIKSLVISSLPTFARRLSSMVNSRTDEKWSTSCLAWNLLWKTGLTSCFEIHSGTSPCRLPSLVQRERVEKR